MTHLLVDVVAVMSYGQGSVAGMGSTAKHILRSRTNSEKIKYPELSRNNDGHEYESDNDSNDSDGYRHIRHQTEFEPPPEKPPSPPPGPKFLAFCDNFAAATP